MTSDELNRIERISLLLSIGLCQCIKSGAIDVSEAERLLFSPSMMRVAREAGASDGLISLIHMGTELEDTESLAPMELGKELDKMITCAMHLLSESSESDSQLDPWYFSVW